MNLVGLKELAELLDVPYDTLKVWKNRDRLPEPFQVISGTPVWDWDTSEEDFRSIKKNENSGRPKKPKISIAGGLIEIDIQGSSKDKDENVSIRVNGKSFVDVQAEPANSANKSDRNLSIKVLGKKVIDINTDDVIETGDKISKPVTEVDGEDTNSETVEVKIGRIPGIIISLLFLYLTALVSMFVLKVAFFLAAVVVVLKSFSNRK